MIETKKDRNSKLLDREEGKENRTKTRQRERERKREA
jgi:hypothetical protein